MSKPDWRCEQINQLSDMHLSRAKQFGLTVLNDSVDLPLEIAEGFRRVGVWALQNTQPISQAIIDKKPFSVLVGMRPPKLLHWGHLTLFRELQWLKSIGGHLTLVLADYEAGAQQNEEQIAEALDLLDRHYRRFTGTDLLSEATILSDRTHLGLRQLQDVVNQHLDVKYLLRLYGWDDKTSLSDLQIASITAAAFLYPGSVAPNRPTLVLSDINQVTHAEVAKVVARKMGVSIPSFSYRLLMPSLLGPEHRMTMKNQASLISLDDNQHVVEQKLKRSYSGGRTTVEEQKMLGGEPLRCSFFSAATAVLNDSAVTELYSSCTAGLVTCGQCKARHIPAMVSKL